MKLALGAAVKFLFGILLVGLLIFLPAGTLNYAGGLRLLCILFLPMLLIGILLLAKDPELLKRRLESREKQASQKAALLSAGILFIGGFITCGLDHRFGWSEVSRGVMICACIIFLGAYLLYWEVMRENTYLSRTVKVEEGQKVIDTGLYGIVRHPMYAAVVLMFPMIPLILGSWYGMVFFAPWPILIVFRLLEEEKLLSVELPGYSEYMKRVKYRLIPFIW